MIGHISLDVQASPGKQEHLYKVLVIGDLGTGKTSIIKRYVHQFFSPHYRATVSSLSSVCVCVCVCVSTPFAAVVAS